jgi:O-antigen ligase
MSKIALNASNFLIILLPLSLITGPMLSDLSVVLLDIFFIYFLWTEKKFSFLDNKIFKYLLLFCLFVSIRSLFTEDILLSGKSALLYFRFTFFAFAISFFLIKLPNLKKNFFISCSISFFLLVIDSYIQFIYGKNLLGYEINNIDKLNSLFGDEAIMGSYISKLLPIYFALLLMNFDIKKNSTLIIISLGFLLSLVFLSGSRASLFLTIIFLFFVFIYLKKVRKLIIILFATITVLLISSSIFSDKVRYKISVNFKDPFERIFKINSFNKKYDNEFIEGKVLTNKKKQIDQSKIIYFSEVHHSHYLTALEMFYDNKLFGQGTKMFRVLCSNKKFEINKYSCSTHPHNFYIQLLAENGIIGFLFLFIVFIQISIFLIKRLYKPTKDIYINNEAMILLLGIYSYIWPIVPSGSLFNNYLSITIYLPLGFYLYFKEKREIHNNE